MTKKEFLEIIADVPDDAVICTLNHSDLIEVTSIELLEDEFYLDENDEKHKGLVIQI